jgi:hypothetical protein
VLTPNAGADEEEEEGEEGKEAAAETKETEAAEDRKGQGSNSHGA